MAPPRSLEPDRSSQIQVIYCKYRLSSQRRLGSFARASCGHCSRPRLSRRSRRQRRIPAPEMAFLLCKQLSETGSEKGSFGSRRGSDARDPYSVLVPGLRNFGRTPRRRHFPQPGAGLHELRKSGTADQHPKIIKPGTGLMWRGLPARARSPARDRQGGSQDGYPTKRERGPEPPLVGTGSAPRDPSARPLLASPLASP